MTIAGLAVYVPETIRPFLTILALIIIPGMMSARVLYSRIAIQLWQVIGLGIGLGLAESLLWGRLLIALGVPTTYLGYMLIVTMLLKMAWSWQDKFQWTHAQKENWHFLIVPVAIIGAIWLTLVQINLEYPTYAVNAGLINDKWSYLTVIEQFLVSQGNLNLRPDTVILGSNTRLAWNSWLFVTASVSEFTGIQPTALIFQYFRPALFGITLFSLLLLGFELFKKWWTALTGVALQLLLLNSFDVYGMWLWMRLEEDKYFAFVTLMPLAWVFLLRAIKYRRLADIIGLSGMSLTLALAHPQGIPGLLLTGAPVAIMEWWFNRRTGFTLRWMAMLLVSMGIFIVITVLDQILITATPYVQNYLAINGSLPTYSLSSVRTLIPAQGGFILLTLIPLGLFALKDPVARILFLMTATCAAVLCVPFVTVLVSELSTSVGINRYFLLIPGGFSIAWLILKIVEYMSNRYVNPFTLTAGVCVLIIVISSWNQWTSGTKSWLFWQDVPVPSLVISSELWRGFEETAALVSGKRAITPVEYGLAAPTLWPRADVLIFNSEIHAPINWPKIDMLYHAHDIATVWALIDDLQPQALYVPRSTTLYNVLAQNLTGLGNAYSNYEMTLFTTEGIEPLLRNDELAFNAAQYTLNPGQCTLLEWDTANLADVQLDGQLVDPSGEQEVCPEKDAVFRLQGTRPDGSTARRGLHIFVSPDYDYMISFSVDQALVQAASCVTLRWHVEEIDSVYYQNKPTVGESSSNECPVSDTLYSLHVKLHNQETIVRNITVYVRDENR
jgi:hypothetical protein